MNFASLSLLTWGISWVPSLIWFTVHIEKHRVGTDFQLQVDDQPEVMGETQAGNATGHLCSSCYLLLEFSWANSNELELKLTCNDSLSCRSLLQPNSYIFTPRHWRITCLLVPSLSTHHLLQCGSSKGRDIFCPSVWISGNIFLVQKVFWKASVTTRNRKCQHKLFSKAKMNMKLSEVEQTIYNSFSLTHL